MTLKQVSLICIYCFLILVIWHVNVADAQQYVTDGLVAFWTLDSADIDGDTVRMSLAMVTMPGSWAR